MTRYTFYTLCLLLFSGTINAQKLEAGGKYDYDHTYHCPTYRFSDKGKNEEPVKAYYTYHISLAGDEATKAIEQAKIYVEQRSGKNFTEMLSVDHIEISYPDKIDEFLKKDDDRYVLSECKIKYYVEFVFKTVDDAKYIFGIFMDEQFNQLFYPHDIPHYYTNPDFYKVISSKKAYNIARKKHKSQLKDAESIALEYDDDMNSFVWQIKGEKKHVNWREVEYWTIKVDANTGEIVGTQKRITSSHNSRFF